MNGVRLARSLKWHEPVHRVAHSMGSRIFAFARNEVQTYLWVCLMEDNDKISSKLCLCIWNSTSGLNVLRKITKRYGMLFLTKTNQLSYFICYNQQSILKILKVIRGESQILMLESERNGLLHVVGTPSRMVRVTKAESLLV